jgi:hypothetical protein
MAEDMMSFYHGDETPGLLPDPYYCKSVAYMGWN